MKVALAFWGITRSLKYTIGSINTNVLDVLKKNKIGYDIFMHTYRVNNYRNIRTNEINNNVDNEEYKLLNPNFVEIHDQDNIKETLNLEEYRTRGDPWNTNYNSLDNFLLAQYSKSKVVKMIKDTNTNYDYIIFLRPDVKYIKPLNLTIFKSVNNNTIAIPDKQLYGKFRFNDRFCICNRNTYQKYGDVFNLLLQISKRIPLHSETVLGGLMIYKYGLKILRFRIEFARVRTNGVIVTTDLH